MHKSVLYIYEAHDKKKGSKELRQCEQANKQTSKQVVASVCERDTIVQSKA